MKKRLAGITPIQIIILIFIIGLLSSFTVKILKENERNARCEEDIRQILSAIDEKRRGENVVLGKVTGNFCSPCDCWFKGMNSSECIDSMTQTFLKLGFPGLMKDPWGNPYIIDENEYENPENLCEFRDNVYSEGHCVGYIPFYTCPNPNPP